MVGLRMYVCMHIYLSIDPSISLSLFINQSINQSIYQSINQSIYLSMYLCIYVSMYVYLYNIYIYICSSLSGFRNWLRRYQLQTHGVMSLKEIKCAIHAFLGHETSTCFHASLRVDGWEEHNKSTLISRGLPFSDVPWAFKHIELNISGTKELVPAREIF